MDSIVRSECIKDEYYTPRYGVLPILPYIPKNRIVWCPFDTSRSEFIRVFRELGIQCVYSHLCFSQDFYDYQPPQWDIIVSNPPFSDRARSLKRCIELKKPFALLLPNIWLNNAPILRLVRDYNLQLLMPDQRIEFLRNGRVSLTTSYFCRNLLSERLIVQSLNKDSKQSSGMYDDPDLIRYLKAPILNNKQR